MPSAIRTLFGAAMIGMVRGQGVVVKAVGDSGTSLGLLVDSSNPNDANFISDAEISANVVNECGRTFVGGNIDIGANTEDALAAGNVTKVTKGSKVKITVDQRNANGTGPFTCDMDQTGNSLATGQTALNVAQDATSGTGETTLTVTMPADMACQGSSQGNVCTVRCRNAADFGGCVAVQQTDVTALPGDNSPSNITTAATLADVMDQIQHNQQDLPAAIAGNDEAAANDNAQSANIAQAILDADSAVVQSDTAELQTKAASASAAAATDATTTTNNNNNGKAKGNGKAGNGKNNQAKGNGKNNKREARDSLRKRIVNVGVDYAQDTQN